MPEKPLTNKAGQVRELAAKDIAAMKPVSEVLPDDLLDVLPKRKVGQRGPQRSPVKISVTIRYSPEVVDYFKTIGPKWQTQMNAVLEKWVKDHPRASE